MTSVSENAASSNTLPPGVVRKSMPFVTRDFVTISDPDLIRVVSSHSDIGRPASVTLPFLFRAFFHASKFYYPPEDSWAAVFQTDGEKEQSLRRQNTIDSLVKGFNQDQINRIEGLIKGNDDLPSLGVKCAKIVAEVILPISQGEELPDEVAKASYDTLKDFPDTFNPIKYLNGRRARATVENYVRKLLPNEKYPGDIAHNLGAAAQGFSAAIQLLQGKITHDVVPTLSKDAMIKGVLRAPLCNTTLDGLFPEDNPLIPGTSLIALDIGTAAAETEDASFLFGVGTNHRQCPFKSLFLDTVNDIHSRNLPNPSPA